MKICEYTNILTRPDTQPKEVSEWWAGAVMQLGEGILGLDELQCGWIEAVILKTCYIGSSTDISAFLSSFLLTQLHKESLGQCQKMAENGEISVQI